MNTQAILAAMTLALTVTFSVGFASQITPRVIYGEDNRLDIHQVTDVRVLELAESTVAILAKKEMLLDQANFKIVSPSLGQQIGLCKDERFYTQPAAANCSGSLIGEDLIMTAGHCVNSTSCDRFYFVFGFQTMGAGIARTLIPSSDVYTCKAVLARELNPSGQDYAVVKLDRPVVGRRPLKLSSTKAQVGEEIFVIGHPSGLPAKVSGGAFIRSEGNGFFRSNLDTYGGNSGSAVFSAATFDVVGILVRGEQDYVYDNMKKCSRSNFCAMDSCRGEDVTHVSFVKDFLNKE